MPIDTEVNEIFAKLDKAQRTLLTKAEVAKTKSRIWRAIGTDPLTQLHNRAYFDAWLDREYARSVRYGHSISLLELDIDGFKQINDRWGHPKGDEYLIVVARILEDAVRPPSDGATSQPLLRVSDTVARYGGEEFVVGLPETDSPQAIAELINYRFNEQYNYLVHEVGILHPKTGKRIELPLQVTLSIGGAAHPTEDGRYPGIADLKSEADKNLYAVKNSGKNAYRGPTQKAS